MASPGHDGGRSPAVLAERLAVRGEVSRFQALAGVGYAAAFALHCLFLIAFLLIDETALAAFNLVSLATYAVNLLLWRRGRVGLPFLLTIVEATFHQLWATLVFGLESGFHYYLLVIFVAGGVVPTWRVWARAIASLTPLVVLVGLVLNGQYNAPFKPPPADWELTFQLANLIGVAVVLMAFLLSYAIAANTAEKAVEAAYLESERLLENILPRPIAARLKHGEQTVAERFGAVTIIFADVVGFTRIVEQKQPDELVDLLDRLIGTFDELAEDAGVEKIKTVGDAWLGVAGLPEPAADHAKRVVELALAMLGALDRIGAAARTPLQIRVGIATGSVVAGVIGRNKFAYDLWGDAVNLAARMESAGIPGKVQVDQATWQLLQEQYEFQPRQVLDVKGKGQVPAYLLEGPSTAA